MPFYALRFSGQWETLSTTAADRSDALSQFSKKLGYEVTEVATGQMTDLMMDEWTENPHWLNPTISVFKK